MKVWVCWAAAAASVLAGLVLSQTVPQRPLRPGLLEELDRRAVEVQRYRERLRRGDVGEP